MSFNYTKTTWAAGDPITAIKMNNLETGIETLNQQQENIIATINSMASGQNASEQNLISTISDTEIVENIAELAATTANKVLVLHDDSDWGTGNSCWFEKSNTWTNYAYARSDGSKVYPMPDQAQLPESHAPREQLMNVLYTWVGNENIHHGAGAASYNNDLFSATCQKDSDNLFDMDCSAFVNAILLGITYANSRYVLGTNADNVELQYMSNHIGPSQSTYMPKGGLHTSEMAMWFAQQGRLFTLPQDVSKVEDMLQFGDILFVSHGADSPNSFYAINHVAFVLGVSGRRVITAESINWNASPHETNSPMTRMHVLSVGDDGTIGPDKRLRVFARPDYQKILQTPAITPYQQGTYQYNAFFLPMAGIRRFSDSGESSSLVSYGALYTDERSMATVDYLPVIPNSTLNYVGKAYNSREKMYNAVRCYEYDANFGLIQATAMAYRNASNIFTRMALTLGSTTKYVRFMVYYSSDSSLPSYDYIWLRDSQDFAVEITPPSVS